MASRRNTSERKRVVLIGQVNSDKSTLYDRLLHREQSLVSDQAGTTTGSMEKLFELPSVGLVLLADAPGLADETPLGAERQQVTRHALSSTDLILYLLSCEESLDTPIITTLRKASAPTLPIVARADLPEQSSQLKRQGGVMRYSGHTPFALRQDGERGLDTLFEAIKQTLSNESEPAPSLLGNLCRAGDLVLLVMPQDSSAPAGRLVLPQMQTIRAPPDRGCYALCVTPKQLPTALSQPATPPQLIITNSQAFTTVEPLAPEDCRLISFSILMSTQRDDLQRLVAGAGATDRLTSTSRILIAEACTHAPEGEDIGTIKLPRLPRKRIDETLTIEHASGRDFPEDLTLYDPIIHCGGCMFNRCILISRQGLATVQQVPMANYGLAVAYPTSILDKMTPP